MDAALITTDLNKGLHWRQTPLESAPLDAAHQVSLYPQARGQRFEGFGGAFTEAAAACWQRLSAENQADFMEKYFGPTGLRYTAGRAHINSCDFALGNYACVDDPADEALAGFSMARDEQYLLPMIRAAQQAAGGPIGLLLSPWSPPAFMKTNGDMNHGGSLKPEYRARWAACMAEYVRRYRAAGCDVRRISVQNEPAAVQTWDSCIYSAGEEGAFAAGYLAPALKAAGCGDVEILCWDHNKEQLVYRAAGTLSAPGAAEAVAGFGIHWYTGDHFDALRTARRLWPGKKFWFTEGCVEYSRFDGAPAVQKAEMYAHDMIGNLSAGVCGSLDWNLLLDAGGGPNHVGNFCEAPLMLDETGRGFVVNGEYYYIGQLSRHIRPGAVCIGCSSYTAAAECCAFENPDGGRVLVLLNRTEADLPVSVTADGETGVSFTLAAHTIATALL